MRIVVLSKGKNNYSTQRLLDVIKERGHEPLLVDYTHCYMEIVEHKPTVIYRGEPVSKVDAVIPRIAASHTAYGTAVVRQFEMMGVYTTAKSIAIVRTRDKLRSLQLLAREGIPIPRSIFASQTEEVGGIVEKLDGAPLIIKLVQSTHGQGVVLAETNKAAKSVIQAFYSIEAPILVQDYVEESEGADIRAFVVGGRVVASMKRQGLEGEFRSNLHQGGVGEKIKLTDEEKKLAIKAAKKLGLEIAGVDLLQSKRGPLVIEVNSSPGLEGIETVTEKDIAGAIVKHVEISAPRRPRKDRIGA